MDTQYPWLKNRGYPHITPQLDLFHDRDKIISLLHNKRYIAKYAFFPLIHAVIQERRYKKIDQLSNKRAHSHIDDLGTRVNNSKKRPLHYATHLDAIIFGFYADIILNKYETILKSIAGLSNCVTAYRRIPVSDTDKNMSTIHFAKEAFDEIAKRTDAGECEVLKFDIKSFFSRINHDILKKSWSKILGVDKLPDDHYNIFKAATKFSYIMRDDFRIKKKSKGKRLGFNEKRLSEIRKKGKNSFFESTEEFRNSVKDGSTRLHKFPFKDKYGNPVGIPQGLPISAVLANVYLLDFDIKILSELVHKLGVVYRRYSDDIIVICQTDQASFIEKFIIEAIEESKVEISKDKTERFLFKRSFNDGKIDVVSIKILKNSRRIGVPFNYLGFEFYGRKTLIKSANLSKFYRRMIRAVKTKCKRAVVCQQQEPDTDLVIYRRQLYKLYTKYPLNATRVKSNFKRLVRDDRGNYFYKVSKRTKKNTSNYLSYVHRAAEIMKEESIKHQIRNHTKIFNLAITKHMDKAKMLQMIR